MQWKPVNDSQSIRFAAPPTGKYRFQAPRAPHVNRSKILPADEFQTKCIQGEGADAGLEDCLYLNVHAPSNAKNLPVVVFIRKCHLDLLFQCVCLYLRCGTFRRRGLPDWLWSY